MSAVIFINQAPFAGVNDKEVFLQAELTA